MMPRFLAADAPAFGCRMYSTHDLYSAQTRSVSSFEPSSTTITCCGRHVWFRTLSIARLSTAARLYVGMTAVISFMWTRLRSGARASFQGSRPAGRRGGVLTQPTMAGRRSVARLQVAHWPGPVLSLAHLRGLPAEATLEARELLPGTKPRRASAA